MAVTITNAELAVAIRAAATEDDIPAPVAAVLSFLAAAAAALVIDYAPKAPDAMHNAAVIRLAGWMFDADPTDSTVGRALQVSGAGPLLARWREQRAAAVTAGQASPIAPAGTGIPLPPVSGSYILTTNNGVLSWIEFPLPA